MNSGQHRGEMGKGARGLECRARSGPDQIVDTSDVQGDTGGWRLTAPDVHRSET